MARKHWDTNFQTFTGDSHFQIFDSTYELKKNSESLKSKCSIVEEVQEQLYNQA